MLGSLSIVGLRKPVLQLSTCIAPWVRLHFLQTRAHLTCMCLVYRRLVLTDHQWLETSSKYLQSIDGGALVPPALPAFVRHLVIYVGELQSLLVADCEASSESWPAGVYPSL